MNILLQAPQDRQESCTAAPVGLAAAGKDGYSVRNCPICRARWRCPKGRAARYFFPCPACRLLSPPWDRVPGNTMTKGWAAAFDLSAETARTILKLYGFSGPTGDANSDFGEAWALHNRGDDEVTRRGVGVTLRTLPDGTLSWVRVSRFTERGEMVAARRWPTSCRTLHFHLRRVLSWLR